MDVKLIARPKNPLNVSISQKEGNLNNGLPYTSKDPNKLTVTIFLRFLQRIVYSSSKKSPNLCKSKRDICDSRNWTSS